MSMHVFAMAHSSYEINAGLDLTPVLNRRLLKNLAKEIGPGFYLRIYGIYIYIFFFFFLKGDKQNLKTHMTLKKSLYESITLI